MADETDIKAGDVVTLKSGGRRFTVGGFATSTNPSGPGDVYAVIIWDSSGGVRQDRVPVHTLVKA